MLKKVDVLNILENGGHIHYMDITSSATVYNEAGEYVDTCRSDTALKISKMDGYKVTSFGTWSYALKIEKDWDKITAACMDAATTLFQNLEKAGVISDLQIEPLPENATAQNKEENKMSKYINESWPTSNSKPFTPETRQEQTDRENKNRCKRIALEVEAYAEGRIYKCPECGEEFEMNEDHGDKYCCPNCGAVYPVEDYEQMNLCDYTEDVLDIRYVVSSRKEVLAVKLLVAFGGPNIWIDTESGNVELYWWGDRASFPLSSDTRDALDEWAQEVFNC